MKDWLWTCEHCSEQGRAESRRLAIAEGHWHVEHRHSKDVEWGFRIRKFLNPLASFSIDDLVVELQRRDLISRLHGALAQYVEQAA